MNVNDLSKILLDLPTVFAGKYSTDINEMLNELSQNIQEDFSNTTNVLSILSFNIFEIPNKVFKYFENNLKFNSVVNKILFFTIPNSLILFPNASNSKLIRLSLAREANIEVSNFIWKTHKCIDGSLSVTVQSQVQLSQVFKGQISLKRTNSAKERFKVVPSFII